MAWLAAVVAEPLIRGAVFSDVADWDYRMLDVRRSNMKGIVCSRLPHLKQPRLFAGKAIILNTSELLQGGMSAR